MTLYGLVPLDPPGVHTYFPLYQRNDYLSIFVLT
jgi:hypothetical protein